MRSESMGKLGSYWLAMAAAIWGCTYAASHGQQPTIGVASNVGVIPDCHGTIAEILLQYVPDVSFELELVYRDLFAALPDDVRIRVLCPTATAADDFIRSWGSVLDKRDIDVVNIGLPISVWARDRCIARQSLDLRNIGATFVPVAPWEYELEKSNDLLLQDILHEARLAPTVMDSQLHLEGGNVVSNLRHVFFGSNVLSENSDLSESRLTAELNMLLGRAYLSIGDESGNVPWCHIDMYLTPISEDTVLVASPRFAHKILSAHDDCDDSEDCRDESAGSICPSDSLQEQFDSVAALAQRNGYKVYRIPAVANVTDQWMITYNNILLDERSGHRIVYMPVYAIPQLDEVAAAVYRGLGFEVRTVDVSELYEQGGALRCVANVTRRRQPSSPLRQTKSDGCIRLVNLAGNGAFVGILDRCRHRLARRSQHSIWGSERSP